MSERELALTDGPVEFAGAVSLDVNENGVQPWRLPFAERQLFNESLQWRGATAAGVRLTLVSDTTSIALEAEPVMDWTPFNFDAEWTFDLLVDGELHGRVKQPCTNGSVRFEDLPEGAHRLELYLPQFSPVRVQRLAVDAEASVEAYCDSRPRWTIYGSSITHCRAASGPSETWPALVANKCGLNLTCLGFGGNCHIEPMVARMIRDLPADLITLKLGINCISGSLGARTFPAAVLGLVQVIREKHPETPIAFVSPIAYPPHETEPNFVGYTIEMMRRDIEDVHQRLLEAGDPNLIYVNGLEVFDADLIAQYATDQCHPNGDGIEVMAENFDRAVMSKFPLS